MNDIPLLAALRQSADPKAVDRIEQLIEHGADRDLNRINALAFAAEHNLDPQKVIAAFLHSAQLGLFEMSWNVLCPSCGGVLDASETLKSVDRERYHCAFCAAGYEPTLDEIVEVTFTVNPRVRRITAHAPDNFRRPNFTARCSGVPALISRRSWSPHRGCDARSCRAAGWREGLLVASATAWAHHHLRRSDPRDAVH